MSKDKKDRNETHYTPRELAAAIATEALLHVLRDDTEWLEDASHHYRRKALDAIERLISVIADRAHLDYTLPERKYSDE